MNTFDLDAARNLPKGTIKRVSDGDREYLDIEGKRVPMRIFPRQLWLALLPRGITEDHVSAIVATLPTAQQYAVKAELKGHVYERTSPWIDQFGAALGLTPDDIDDVFVEGSAL
jgi:hypothetical protein